MVKTLSRWLLAAFITASGVSLAPEASFAQGREFVRSVARIQDYGGSGSWQRHYVTPGIRTLIVDLQGPGPGGGFSTAQKAGGGGGRSASFRMVLHWNNGAPSGFYFDVLTQLGAGPGFLANAGIIRVPKEFCESPDPVNDPNAIPVEDFHMIAGSGMPGGSATSTAHGQGGIPGNVASTTPDQDPNGPNANTPGYRSRWPRSDGRGQWNYSAAKGERADGTIPGTGGGKGDNGCGGDGAAPGGQPGSGCNGYAHVMELF